LILAGIPVRVFRFVLGVLGVFLGVFLGVLGFFGLEFPEIEFRILIPWEILEGSGSRKTSHFSESWRASRFDQPIQGKVQGFVPGFLVGSEASEVVT
jgi:hypothetical protein